MTYLPTRPSGGIAAIFLSTLVFARIKWDPRMSLYDEQCSSISSQAEVCGKALPWDEMRGCVLMTVSNYLICRRLIGIRSVSALLASFVMSWF